MHAVQSLIGSERSGSEWSAGGFFEQSGRKHFIGSERSGGGFFEQSGRKHSLHLKLHGANSEGGITISGKTNLRPPRWTDTMGGATPKGRNSPATLGDVRDAVAAARANFVDDKRRLESDNRTLRTFVRKSANNREELRGDLAAEVEGVRGGFAMEREGMVLEREVHTTVMAKEMEETEDKNEKTVRPLLQKLRREERKVAKRDVLLKSATKLLKESKLSNSGLQSKVAEMQHAVQQRDALDEVVRTLQEKRVELSIEQLA